MKTCLVAAAILASGSAYAHHSLAATYLMDKEVTIHGTVVEFLLRNPHSWVAVYAPDETGKMQRWAVEWSPGGLLSTRGIKPATFKVGDEVTITMMPGQNAQAHRGLMKIIRRPSDGFEWGTKPGETVPNWMPPMGKGGDR